MRRIFQFGKVALTDAAGILCIIGSILFGWLPGPGGIPLFILGLSLLAINHPWAQRYIDLAQEYAHRLGELIFIKNPVVQVIYDIAAVALVFVSYYFFKEHAYIWHYSAGVFFGFFGLTIFLGNRQRWRRIKQQFKHKR